jgi:prepilin-type N-terminal cleavage/methylation domain-containing protein
VNRATRTRRPTRAGFTLIEILVVIAIIAVLLSLGMGGYMAVRRVQNVRRAEDVVAKLQAGVDNQVKALGDRVRAEQLNKSDEYTALLNYCGDADRAAALLMYCRLRQNFPLASELGSTIPAGPLAGQPGFMVGGASFQWPTPFLALKGMGGTAQQQQAAVLYVTLSQRAQSGNAFASDEATTGAQTDIVVGGNSYRVYKDSWDNPIAFKRFHEAADLPGQTSGVDPFDPTLKLANWQNKGAAQNALGITFDGQNKIITVFSTGADGAASPNLDGDDVAGYRLRAIGARGTQTQ